MSDDILKRFVEHLRFTAGEAGVQIQCDSCLPLADAVEQLTAERERLALAICGGEDAPGYANAQTVETLEHVAKQNQLSHGATINSLLAAEAERDRLREAARFKPLVWFEAELPSRGGGKITAEGYTIRRIEGLWLLDFAGESKSVWRWADLQAAKAAAQADYEARILSALEPAVQPDADLTAERDRQYDENVHRIAMQAKAEAERDRLREALKDIVADCEAAYPPSHGAIKYAAKLALKGESQ